jgi:5-carboxymethyl-2-hydroxymuconate isomerase
MEFDELFARIHAVLADVGAIKKANCKSRALELDRFYVGDGTGTAGFIHLDVRFLEGRTETVKHEIGTRLVAILQDCYPSPPNSAELQITVEIRDIQRSTYFKIPAGTLEYG